MCGVISHSLEASRPLRMRRIRESVALPWLLTNGRITTGTTAIACERLNRKWIGIEISEEYCEITAKRIEKETQQLKLFN